MSETIEITLRETHYAADEPRPGMFGVQIPGARGRLFARLFTAGGAGPHPAVLMCHGIPGIELNLDLCQFLRREGFHVLAFNYSGCWGSDGDYSISHDLEDARTAFEWLLADETYDIDKSRLFVIGHSLGGFTGGHLLAEYPQARAGALLMICDIGRAALMRSSDPSAFAALAGLLENRGGWLSGCAGDDLLNDVLAHTEAFRLENCAAALAQKPILCVTGDYDADTSAHIFTDPLDAAIRAAGGTRFTRVSFPTDHAFCDHRLTVAAAVSDYLKAQC